MNCVVCGEVLNEVAHPNRIIPACTPACRGKYYHRIYRRKKISKAIRDNDFSVIKFLSIHVIQSSGYAIALTDKEGPGVLS